MDEFQTKQQRILRLLQERGLGALHLRRAGSFAWATCGASSQVNQASSFGEASLLVTPQARVVICNNIEAPRLVDEEGLEAQGWEMRVTPWHEDRDALRALLPTGPFGADESEEGAVDLSVEVAHLRAELTPPEEQRFRELGKLCAQAISAAARGVRPGQSELEIAAGLSRECENRGVQATVNLVASDERVYRYRHPLPTAKTLERYAMLVVCGRKAGLICSVTRLVHFGKLPAELARRQEAIARVDAQWIRATRPGRALGDVFREGVAAYGEVGFPEEWRRHHQGGPAGYEPREWLARPDSPEIIRAGQAFAWNPSIEGIKMEDTQLVGQGEPEILTTLTDWPTIQVALDGGTLPRPAILEIT
ncbi:MAG: M24 family metallopeptidase [Anaerolineales bacterium]|jgi:antitoxin VapB